ncbi:MAG: type II toxin-antitoxin system RelE family toxin [Acidimicrobiales bacterium]
MGAEGALGLADDPRPRGCEKLAGMADAWRIRSGNYRVVYTIDDHVQVVTITRVGHRREVYRRR